MPSHMLVAIGLVALLLATLLVRADEAVSPLAGFDEYAEAALADWKTPGMAIAITKDGSVVLARVFEGHDQSTSKRLFRLPPSRKCLSPLVRHNWLKGGS
jgi:CubicO group peptidase (beta-lactamase class C family)